MKTSSKLYLSALFLVVLAVLLPYLSFLPFSTVTLNKVSFVLIILAVIILGKDWWTKGIPSEKNSADRENRK
ncbi:hypothetical protein SAMN02745116_00489 [Pilibacter termitis]|uniref:Uncharacterized protein n=1 Tax=Pilibacter termitis TaxID=263852 RepID=A0A1T4L1L0_9ENTE|nr:hypothetical protein [Pilibacter termitis]SJZ48576.1 hypothetical protein SAMN02745116_00489 [Pilibacter termitis]